MTMPIRCPLDGAQIVADGLHDAGPDAGMLGGAARR